MPHQTLVYGGSAHQAISLPILSARNPVKATTSHWTSLLVSTPALVDELGLALLVDVPELAAFAGPRTPPCTALGATVFAFAAAAT